MFLRDDGRYCYGAVDPGFVLGNATLFTACTILPLAAALMFNAIRPYREEVERLESIGL